MLGITLKHLSQKTFQTIIRVSRLIIRRSEFSIDRPVIMIWEAEAILADKYFCTQFSSFQVRPEELHIGGSVRAPTVEIRKLAMDLELSFTQLEDDYLSFRRVSEKYKHCLLKAGLTHTGCVDTADVVIIYGTIDKLSLQYRRFPQLERKYVIAVIAWETDKLPPEFVPLVRVPNEIWTPSRYSLSAIEQARPGGDVYVMPHVVELPKPDSATISAMKERIAFQEGMFHFYTIGRFTDPRKNMLTAIRSLQPMLSAGKARLVVKAHSEPASCLAGIMRLPGVCVLADPLTAEEIAALHQICDCYVSAHCAEAWGLGASEAMASGNLVVATGFSGNMDFMTDANSLPVDYSCETIRRPVASDAGGYWTRAMNWAYVDEADLQEKLHSCLSDWQQYCPLRERARLDMTRFSSDRVSLLIAERMRAVLKTLAFGGPARTMQLSST